MVRGSVVFRTKTGALSMPRSRRATSKRLRGARSCGCREASSGACSSRAALASEAKIVLADEPTAGLDVRHVLDAHRMLRRMADAGRAVVVVLHDLDDARVFGDCAVLLAHGRVVAQGTPAEVVSQAFVRAVYAVTLHERSGLRFRRPG